MKAELEQQEELTDQGPLFRDRRDAGEALAKRLERHRGTHALVLGLPRGGVPVAAQVARALDADLDVLVSRKLGSPVSAELAIGAVTANGGRFLNEDVLRMLNVSEAYLTAVTETQQAEARRREALFRGPRPAPVIAGRTVILVDDGLATGATMRAAVRSVRQQQPKRLVVAVPVGSREACAALRGEADDVVCLYEPKYFGAVGYYYEDFSQTEDSDVQTLLEEFAGAGGPR
ncbi:MAG TPA: phosphoribosyltransferase [Gemmatimonadales bacterium]